MIFGTYWIPQRRNNPHRIVLRLLEIPQASCRKSLKTLNNAKWVLGFFSQQTTKAFLPRMLELRHGHVVCINSILSLSSIPGAIDYCTSKASAYAFMESLTLGLLDCPGVDCTTILPFHTDTEMFQGMRVRYCSATWRTEWCKWKLNDFGNAFIPTRCSNRSVLSSAGFLSCFLL